MKLPEYTEKFGNVVIKIYQDSNASNPFKDGDCEPDIIGWHRRYDFNTREEDNNKEPEDFLREAKENGYIVLPLYMYEHGGIVFNTARTGQFSDRWDSGHFGFIFWTKKKIEDGQGEDYCKRITVKKRKFLIDQLENSVKLLNDYVMENVYGFVIENKEGKHLDSCWGFYGYYNSDYGALSEAKSQAAFYSDKIGEENARELESSRPDMYGSQNV